MRYLTALLLLIPATLLFARLTRAEPLVTPGYAVNYYLSEIDGSYQPYGVYIPDPYRPDEPHPVVLHLHGFGGRLGGFSRWQREWADSNGWILAYPDGRGSNNYDGIGEDDLFRVLDDLKARYHVDEDRIYLTGGSMGGHGSFRMPLRYPHIFTAGAPIAGWTDYREFYPHFYEQAEGPKLPEYVDPSRRPILETASSLWQVENGRYNWLLIGYGTWDYVNPPSNAEQVVQRAREFGFQGVTARGDWGGHGAGYDTEEIYNWFLGKARVRKPENPTYVTNTVKYNRGHWLRIDRLRVFNQWARLSARARRQVIQVEASNVARYTLLDEGNPVDFTKNVTVYTNGLLSYQGVPNGPLTLEARTDERHRVVGWGTPQPPLRHGPAKRHGLQGPIADAFLSRFVVVYGTTGTRAETRRNYEDALRFCAEWNNWMTLHWGWEKPPKERMRNWWEAPYPMRPGAYTPENQPLLRPIRDTELTDEQIASANLLLFGDLKSHATIARIAGELPLTLTRSGVIAGNRTYAGPSINYVFVAPNPLNPNRYVVVSRGYLSSRIDPYSSSPSTVGKDLEALPFFWPDYVIWDGNRKPAPTVQSPFVYLPETYLEAGYFDDGWALDANPPGTTAFIDGDGQEGVYASPVEIALVAEDQTGGFGVARTEYRLNGGPWEEYTGPILVESPGNHVLQFRSVDRCGRFLYEVNDGHSRGYDAPGNVEAVRSVSFRVTAKRSASR